MTTTEIHPMPVAEYRRQLVRALRRVRPDLRPSERRRILDEHMADVTESDAIAALAR